MTPTIISYTPSLLEEHVALGNELTRDWKYFGQTGLDVMKQQYARPDFDPDTRLYAIDNGRLVGFHTAAITRPRFARVEFPIVHPDYPELLDRLMDHQLEVLKSKGVTTIQSRATPFWGETEKLAQQFGYTFDRDLYFITNIATDNLTGLDLTTDHPTMENYDDSKHYSEVKRILMDWYDCSEELAESYIAAYGNPGPGTLLNQVVMEENLAMSRATLSKYVDEENNRVLGFTSIYTDPDHPELLLPTLNYVFGVAKENAIDTTQCYLSGLTRPQLAAVLDPLGWEFTNALSFYVKQIAQ